jgi:hypothetical protein
MWRLKGDQILDYRIGPIQRQEMPTVFDGRHSSAGHKPSVAFSLAVTNLDHPRAAGQEANKSAIMTSPATYEIHFLQ